MEVTILLLPILLVIHHFFVVQLLLLHLWIIDSGASDHTTPTLSSFVGLTPAPSAKPVKLPTGYVAPITHTGSIKLSPYLSLHDVLCVPSFHFDLLSVSKLTQTLNCAAIFFFNFLCFSGPVLEETDWSG